MARHMERQYEEKQHGKGQAQTVEILAINEKLVIAAVRQQELAETATRNAESAVKRGELYRLLAKNFPDGMVLLFDQGLRHILAGGRGLFALGLSKEALEGQTIWEVFEPQTCQQIEPAYRAALAGTESVLEIPLTAALPLQEKRERMYRVHTLPITADQGNSLPGMNILTGMAVAQDVTEQRQSEEVHRWQAYHDVLTGLPNRALLQDRLSQVLAMAERSGELAGLLFLDLNHFKQVNDTLGHAAGDNLLEAVAARLTDCLRAEDTVARIGGDEFVVLLPGIHGADDAAHVAQKITELLAAPFQVAGHEISVTVSVGISVFPFDGRDSVSLLTHADAAMYRSKKDHQSHI